jgi:predicted ArsR family transcriptional regulator
MPTDKNSTRSQILELLKRRGELTIKQLSEEVGITTMGVRQHLASLAQEGLVQCRMQRQKLGRPVQVYSLTETANLLFPSSYSSLVISLLEHLAEIDGQNKVLTLFRKRQERLCQEYGERLKGLKTQERFQTFARLRNQDGYMCEWSLGPKGANCITEYHCPICDVARRYPELCSMELSLLEQVLGTKLVRQEHKMSGGKCCSYAQAR